MEEGKTTPGNIPQNTALATWSLILGIISIPLFILILPETLAVIFGIVALLKISKSAGTLTGKGKAIAGLVLGGLAFILIPVVGIVAAIAIPNFMQAKKMAAQKMAEMDEMAAQMKASRVQVPNVLTTKTAVSTDGVCQVTLPAGWVTQTDLHDKADLQVANKREELYLIVLSASKLDFEDMSLEGHSKLTRQGLLDSIQNGRIIGEPKNFNINGLSALQYELRGSANDLNVVYLHTTIEGKNHFHQVLAWTLLSEFDKNKAALESVINTFEETETE